MIRQTNKTMTNLCQHIENPIEFSIAVLIKGSKSRLKNINRLLKDINQQIEVNNSMMMSNALKDAEMINKSRNLNTL